MSPKTKSNQTARRHVLTVKLSDEEYALLKRVTEERCVNLSKFVRRVLFEALRALPR